VLFRRRQDHGNIKVDWSYQDDAVVPASLRAPRLAFVEALHQRGVLVIEDVDGNRPQLEFATVDQPMDPTFHALRLFLEDLAVIEEWTGRHDPNMAGRIPAEDVREVATVARIVKEGEVRTNFEQVTLVVPPERVAYATTGKGPLLVEMDLVLPVLGKQYPVGRVRGEMTDTRTLVVGEPDANGHVTVRIEPASEEAAHPIFKLRRFTDEEWAERGYPG
jgi:hypothetical protein